MKCNEKHKQSLYQLSLKKMPYAQHPRIQFYRNKWGFESLLVDYTTLGNFKYIQITNEKTVSV